MPSKREKYFPFPNNNIDINIMNYKLSIAYSLLLFLPFSVFHTMIVGNGQRHAICLFVCQESFVKCAHAYTQMCFEIYFLVSWKSTWLQFDGAYFWSASMIAVKLNLILNWNGKHIKCHQFNTTHKPMQYISLAIILDADGQHFIIRSKHIKWNNKSDNVKRELWHIRHLELFLRIKSKHEKCSSSTWSIGTHTRNVKKDEESARMKRKIWMYREREAELYTPFTGLVHIPSVNGSTRCRMYPTSLFP